MRFIRFIGVTLISAVFAGCAAQQPNFQQVETPPKAIVQNGYSFVPLDDPQWYIIGRTPFKVALSKKGSATDETYVINGELFRFPEFASDEAFLQAIKQGQSTDLDPANPTRYKRLVHDAELRKHRGETCVFSHVVTEDHGAKKRTSTAGFMILDVYALVCRHPQNQNAAITVGYSQRNYPENRDGNIESKARQLIESVDFTTLR